MFSKIENRWFATTTKTIVALILFLPGVNAIPSITDDSPDDGLTTRFEDFSDRTSTTDYEGPVEALGIHVASGTGGSRFVDTTLEAFSFKTPTSGTTTVQNFYSLGDANICGPGGVNDQDAVLSYKVTLVTAPSAVDSLFAGFSELALSVGTADHVGVRFFYDGTAWDIFTIVSGGTADVGSELFSNQATGTTFTISFSGLDCSSAAVVASISNGVTTEVENLDAAGDWSGNSYTILDAFGMEGDATPLGGKMTVDDISVIYTTTTPQTGTLIFCSDITETGTYPFGYNYKTTGVTAVAVSGSDTNNALTFVGEDQVAAKGWTPGSNTIKAYFNVRARSDGETSYFNLALSTVSGTPSVTTFGNGETTQAFADHVRLKMTEGPTYWQGLFSYVSAGGAVTNLGTSFVMHEANLFTNYYVTMDTTPAELSISLTKQNGDELVAERALPAAFSGDVIYSEWLIGNDVTAADGQTDLLVGSQISGSFSTCIYDLAGDGAAPVGSAGAADTSPVEPDEQPGEETDPDALGDTPGPGTPIGIVRTELEEGWGMDFGWILGMATVAILIVIFAGYATGLAGSAAAIVMGVGVLIGVGLAVTLDFLPVWMLVLTAFLVVALFTMVLFGGKEEGSE